MTEQGNIERNPEPSISNAAIAPSGDVPAFRNPIPSTSFANSTLGPPVLPPRPDLAMQPSYSMTPGYSYGGMNSYGMGGMGMGGMGYSNYGYGGYGGYGMGGMGGMGGIAPYGGYNRYGPMHGDIENRFIQMAEESSRPAFDSIQSVVNAVGSVAMMLENTFFALTSSFRAILGATNTHRDNSKKSKHNWPLPVSNSINRSARRYHIIALSPKLRVAENFGRLRSLFAQFWSTFAVVRSLNWLVRKLMVMLGIRTENEFKAWAEAVAATQTGTGTAEQRAKGASWPILLFFGVIAAAPYIVLRMMSGLTASVNNERLNDPTSWQNPLRAVAQHEFQATSPQELSFRNDQVVLLAPQHLQGPLWNSGWLMGSTDRQTAGLLPTNYIKVIKPEDKDDKAVDDMANHFKQEL